MLILLALVAALATPAASHTLPILKPGGYIGATATLISPHYVLTAHHTVDDVKPGKPVFMLCGDTITAGFVRKVNKERDLAILELVDDCIQLQPLALAAKDLPVGEAFFTQGYPGGHTQKTFKASVASYETVDGAEVMMFDGSVARGSSGGAGFVDGVLVGIISGYYVIKFADGDKLTLGVLVPASAILQFISDLE